MTRAEIKTVPVARFDIKLDGFMKTMEPLAHAPPLPKGEKTNDKVARLARMPVQDSLTETGYVPGGAARGVLRRAADKVVRKLVGNPKVGFLKATQSRVGGAKGSEETTPDFKRREAIRLADPVIGLFGAGSSPVGFIEGRLSISHLIPTTPIIPVVVPGARRAENRTEEFMNQLSDDEVLRAEQYGEANAIRSKLKTEIKEIEIAIWRAKAVAKEKGVKADTADLEAKLAVKTTEHEEAEKRAANLGSTNTIGMPLAGYEVIPAGVTLRSQIIARQVTEGEAAVLIAAMKGWAFNPRIGAKVAHNCGTMSGAWKVSISTDDEWESKGDMIIDGEGGFTYTGPQFKMPQLDLAEYLATV